MYIPEHSFKTIKEAQADLLKLILEEGEEIEDTLEINNISVYISNPLLNSEELFKDITSTAEKHCSQMMLEPNPKLEKTHYGRLHNFLVGNKKIHEIGENLVSYDQIEEVIKRLKENPFSKRCVLTLWSPEDVNDKYALSFVFAQLFIRNNKLIMTNYFRSCDIWNGLSFNILGIAKLHSEIAIRLNIETGEFILHIGSAHIYKNNIEKIKCINKLCQ